MEESEILEKQTDNKEPTVDPENAPTIEEKPSAAVEDLTSILGQQASSGVPLTEHDTEKELATPVEAKK
jgi:hypothetical protein